MADLIIRGMEMPKNGYECPMNSFGICHVATDGENCECYDVRPDWCPLIPLPEGHGRLIDGEALFQVIGQDTDRWLIDDISYIETDDAISAVYKAPTIVPAEGGTENGA